jgi:hypothetical protein
MDTKNSDSGDKGLSSAEYRARLLTKLNCLIAVLEVAIAKISRSMDLPGANEERLLKIRSNLENTLSICNRAKQTLESGMPRKALPGATAPGGERKMSYRDYVELSSIEEYKRFKGLPPIRAEEVGETDIDGLIDQFFVN